MRRIEREIPILYPVRMRRGLQRDKDEFLLERARGLYRIETNL
jgi:hypothetical protein